MSLLLCLVGYLLNIVPCVLPTELLYMRIKQVKPDRYYLFSLHLSLVDVFFVFLTAISLRKWRHLTIN